MEREHPVGASGRPSSAVLNPKRDIFSFSLREKAGMRGKFG